MKYQILPKKLTDSLCKVVSHGVLYYISTVPLESAHFLNTKNNFRAKQQYCNVYVS